MAMECCCCCCCCCCFCQFALCVPVSVARQNVLILRRGTESEEPPLSATTAPEELVHVEMLPLVEHLLPLLHFLLYLVIFLLLVKLLDFRLIALLTFLLCSRLHFSPNRSLLSPVIFQRGTRWESR